MHELLRQPERLPKSQSPGHLLSHYLAHHRDWTARECPLRIPEITLEPDASRSFSGEFDAPEIAGWLNSHLFLVTVWT